MKTENPSKQIRLDFEPANRAAISAALDQLQSISRDQERNLAVIVPELDGIRRDASSRHGAVELVVRDYLADSRNKSTAFTKALRSQADLHAQTMQPTGVLVEDAGSRALAIHATLNALVVQAKSVVELHLQAFFTPAQLPIAMTRARLVQLASECAERYQTHSWALSLQMQCDRADSADGKNTAAEIIRIYRAQLSTFDATKAAVATVAAEIEAVD